MLKLEISNFEPPIKESISCWDFNNISDPDKRRLASASSINSLTALLKTVISSSINASCEVEENCS